MTISRRVFLRTTAACSVTAAALSGSVGCSNGVDPAPIADVTVEDNPNAPLYGQIAVATMIYPELAASGGAITLRVLPMAAGNHPFTVPTNGILLIHRGQPGDKDEYVALDASCPHMGCPLGYSAGEDLIKCPCHGSRFRAVADPNDLRTCAGEVVHRPARANLTTWPVNVERDGMIYVDLQARASCGDRSLPPLVDGKVVISLSDFPALAEVGGSVTGSPKGLGDKIIVIRVDDANVAVLTDVCTHMGCPVEFSAENQEIECRCHGSTFNVDGAVTGGPAPAPLKKYVSAFDGSTITISVS